MNANLNFNSQQLPAKLIQQRLLRPGFFVVDRTRAVDDKT